MLQMALNHLPTVIASLLNLDDQERISQKQVIQLDSPLLLSISSINVDIDCAVRLGCLRIAQQRRRSGYHWTRCTFARAWSGGYIEILNWLSESGCNWGIMEIMTIHNYGDIHPELLEWLRNKGPSIILVDGGKAKYLAR